MVKQYSANAETFSNILKQSTKDLKYCVQVIPLEKRFRIKNDFFNLCRRECKMSCVEYHYEVKSKNLLQGKIFQSGEFLQNSTDSAVVNVNFAKNELAVVMSARRK